MNRSNSLYMSTTEVAETLKVSVTTVKRWVDDGTLPAHKTAGGHRKLVRSEVMRLINENNWPGSGSSSTDIEVPTPVTLDDLDVSFDLVDCTAIRRWIQLARIQGWSVVRVADEALAPAMARIGPHSQGKNIINEHRITQACMSALYDWEFALDQIAFDKQPVALGAAPEHDHFVLPTLLAKMTLLEAGWNAINLGPHTPIQAFRSAIERYSPRLIWLSTTYIVHVDRFLADAAELYTLAEKHGVALAVGGSALTSEIRSRMRYSTYGDRLHQLQSIATILNPAKG